MLEISYAGFTPVLSAQFTLKMCVSQPKKAKKNHLKPIFWGSRSFMVIDVMLVPTESSSAVFVMIRSKSVSICNRSHTRLVGSS